KQGKEERESSRLACIQVAGGELAVKEVWRRRLLVDYQKAPSEKTTLFRKLRRSITKSESPKQGKEERESSRLACIQVAGGELAVKEVWRRRLLVDYQKAPSEKTTLFRKLRRSITKSESPKQGKEERESSRLACIQVAGGELAVKEVWRRRLLVDYQKAPSEKTTLFRKLRRSITKSESPKQGKEERESSRLACIQVAGGELAVKEVWRRRLLVDYQKAPSEKTTLFRKLRRSITKSESPKQGKEERESSRLACIQVAGGELAVKEVWRRRLLVDYQVCNVKDVYRHRNAAKMKRRYNDLDPYQKQVYYAKKNKHRKGQNMGVACLDTDEVLSGLEEREVENRMSIFPNSSLSKSTVNKLITVLDVNPYAKSMTTWKKVYHKYRCHGGWEYKYQRWGEVYLLLQKGGPTDHYKAGAVGENLEVQAYKFGAFARQIKDVVN
ncbi:lipid-transfer protein, partial [Striga asiatica]